MSNFSPTMQHDGLYRSFRFLTYDVWSRPNGFYPQPAQRVEDAGNIELLLDSYIENPGQPEAEVPWRLQRQ